MLGSIMINDYKEYLIYIIINIVYLNIIQFIILFQ